MTKNKLSLIISGALLMASAAGYAQEQQTDAEEQTSDASNEKRSDAEVIVVTAQRKTQNLQAAAASISVRDGEKLRLDGKFHLSDILENIPGVTGGAAESTATTPGGGTDTAGAGAVIRGIKSNVGAGGGITSTAASVAVYVDDVYEGVGSTYDINTVEVLRGPQGTLYGRSATGGVIAVNTKNPSLDEMEGMVLLEGGNYGLQHYSGAINVPVIEDKFAVRISGDHYEREGFDTAEGLGNRKNTNLRLKALAQPTDDLSILFGIALQDNEDATGGMLPGFDADGNLIFEENPVGEGENQFRQYWANIQWDMGFATLTYIPALRKWEQDAENVGSGPGFNITQTLYTPKDEFYTHELRLTSPDTSEIDWQLGVFKYANELTNTNAVRFALPGEPLAFQADTEKETDAMGIFAETTIPVNERLRVTLGLRYDKTDITVAQDYTDGGVFNGAGPTTYSLPAEEGDLGFSNWTYKLKADYDLTKENMVYASFSTGFSPGDVTVTSDPTGQPYVIELDEQTLTSYEVGSKNYFLDNTLRVNGSLYYYDYSGYQNAGIDIDPTDNLAFATLVSPVEVKGGEVEIVYFPTYEDVFGIDIGYTDAKYVERSDFFKTFIARDEVANIPPLTVSLNYSHRFDLSSGADITFKANSRFISSHDTGTITALDVSLGGSELVQTDSLWITNLTTSWTSSDAMYSVSAYVRNLTDERYPVQAEVDSTTGVITGGTYTLTAPRTFGVVLNVNF